MDRARFINVKACSHGFIVNSHFLLQVRRRRHRTTSRRSPAPLWPRRPSCAPCCSRTASVTTWPSRSACSAWRCRVRRRQVKPWRYGDALFIVYIRVHAAQGKNEKMKKTFSVTHMEFGHFAKHMEFDVLRL